MSTTGSNGERWRGMITGAEQGRDGERDERERIKSREYETDRGRERER